MNTKKCLGVTLFVGFVSILMAPPATAALILIDFAGEGPNSSGAAVDWDVFDDLVQDMPNPLTDRSGGGDDDVTLTALDDSFSPNNPAPPGVGAVYDGIDVPKEARDDYLFKTDDTAGTTARLMFENLDPGLYNITVFEGRLSDANQVAKIWAGDFSGSGEPASENTGNFAQGHSTVTLNIPPGEVLWYRHLEDNTGGIGGMIINQLSGVSDVEGDVDGNDIVDFVDYEIIRDNFLVGRSREEGNLDRRGVTDFDDFKIWKTAFEAAAAPASVPEPSTLALFVVAIALAPRIRHRSSRTNH